MNTVFTKDDGLQPYPWLRVLLGFAAGMFIFLFISRVVDFAMDWYDITPDMWIRGFFFSIVCSMKFWLYTLIPSIFLVDNMVFNLQFCCRNRYCFCIDSRMAVAQTARYRGR